MTDPRNSLPGVPASLIDRVKNILMTPKTEWPRIAAEPATVQGLFTGYIMILAAIQPICMLIGQQAFVTRVGVYTISLPLSYSITTAILQYVMSLVGVYVLSLIIDALAPSFGGTKNPLAALKAVAYSWTAAWLAGIFYIFPPIAMLAIVGLYSLYLLYLGLPVLMRVPQDKAVGYVVVTIICAVVMWIVIGVVVGMLVVAFVGMPGAAGGFTVR